MPRALLLAVLVFLAGCNPVSVNYGDTISAEELESFFRKHKVEQSHAVALKKRSLGGTSYLVTIHGYADNRVVCEMLIEPYNKSESLSVIPGSYYCEELR